MDLHAAFSSNNLKANTKYMIYAFVDTKLHLVVGPFDTVIGPSDTVIGPFDTVIGLAMRKKTSSVLKAIKHTKCC
jgi:hypothetical protein